MRLVALVSGGKDSCFNMMECIKNNHSIVALANLHPPCSSVDEMDSFMYQTVGHSMVELIADAMEIPLYRRKIAGGCLNQSLNYVATTEDETEDLYLLLNDVKIHQPNIEGVSVGAILSNYQRTRAENVCSRLGLSCFGFLWKRPQDELLTNMIDCSVYAILIKVAALGLTETHLGKSLAEMQDCLLHLNKAFGLNVCGEGGEYETFVLDCPIFKKRIVLDSSEIIKHDLGGVSYLRLKGHTEKKEYLDQSRWSSYVEDKTLIPKSDVLFHEIYHNEIIIKECDNNNEMLRDSNGNISFPIMSLSCLESSGHLFISNITSLKLSLEDIMADIHKQLYDCLVIHGHSFDSILHTTIILQDMDLFANVNSYYSKWFIEPLPPSRACIASHLLPTKVSLSVISKATSALKRGLHIQSRSYWAPSNIGPYSQLRRTDEFVFIAGQIGLVPSTMELPKDVRLEAILALRSFHRILEAENINLFSIQVMLCFTVNEAYRDLITRIWSSYRPSAKLIILVVDKLPRNSRIEWVSILGIKDTKLEIVRDICSNTVVFLFSVFDCPVPNGCCFIPVRKILGFENGSCGISLVEDSQSFD